MPKKVLIGIDIGTQGAKGVLCTLDGRVLAADYREHTISTPQSGWAEQDAERVWWQSFTSLSKQLIDESGVLSRQVAGVGISAFVPALLVVGGDGLPLRPAILYTDRRAVSNVQELNTLLNEAGIPYQKAGPVSLASPIAQLLWLRDHEPEIWRRTARIFQCHNYLVYKLCGQFVIDQPMKRSYTPVFDPEIDGWSTGRAKQIGLDLAMLPEDVLWPAQSAGIVCEQAARETGLPVGTPVAVGTADAFAEMVGAGVVLPDTAAALYGSLTAIMVARSQPSDPYHGYHCLPDLYFSGAAVPTGAVLTRWFRDEFGQLEVNQQSRTGKSAYHYLDQLAAEAPAGCDGLIAIPDFSGEIGAIHPQIPRGALLGLTLEHDRAHVYRALLEGIAFELRRQLITEADLPKTVMAVGGGTAGQVWPQIMSDILGLEQEVVDIPLSAATFGSAYLGGMAAGLFHDVDVLLEKWIRVNRKIVPNRELTALYDSCFHAYCDVYRALV